MNSKERFEFFGKCCWTCENTDCPLSQINGQPPHESGEGRDCDHYKPPKLMCGVCAHCELHGNGMRYCGASPTPPRIVVTDSTPACEKFQPEIVQNNTPNTPQREDLLYSLPGTFIQAGALDVIQQVPTPNFVFLDPPYEKHSFIRRLLKLALAKRAVSKCAVACFMWLRDVPQVFDGLGYRDADSTLMPAYPDSITVWEKPQSTKNTSKDYSQFLEAICVWHGEYFNKELHWANRTGIFVDRLIEKPEFLHKKPDTLVERLVKLHTPSGGSVLDLCAGTGTVKDVCDRCGFYSLSCDIDPKGSLKQ